MQSLKQTDNMTDICLFLPHYFRSSAAQQRAPAGNASAMAGPAPNYSFLTTSSSFFFFFFFWIL